MESKTYIKQGAVVAAHVIDKESKEMDRRLMTGVLVGWYPTKQGDVAIVREFKGQKIVTTDIDNVEPKILGYDILTMIGYVPDTNLVVYFNSKKDYLGFKYYFSYNIRTRMLHVRWLKDFMVAGLMKFKVRNVHELQMVYDILEIKDDIENG